MSILSYKDKVIGGFTSDARAVNFDKTGTALECTNVEYVIKEINTKTEELNTNLENLENNKLDKKDISDWAKASTKPSYKWTEITNKPYLIYTLSGAAKIREISIQINGSPYMQVVTESSTAYGVNVWESDTKLKKNIAPTDQTALDKVKQIDFVQFDWKDTDKHVDLGVTANQLETVIPSAVYDVPQGEKSEFDSLKNIDTGIMATYALKAIQELSNIIEKQQQEINTLKEKIKYAA